MNNDSIYNYTTPIHKSLIQDDVQLSIGLIPASLIIIITIILMRFISIWCIFVGFFFFLLAKILNKKDPHFLESLFDRLFTSDYYRSC